MDHATHAGRIPLTVIGGFLGTGKTTLLNHLLEHNEGRRLAILVNDFGAINIDAALVAQQDAGIVSLANGCVCCSIGDDLSEALIRVIEAPQRPDAIIIEASGVSDPWRIAQVGLADPALGLDSVVVMVDAASVREQAADPLLNDTVLRQLKAADLLVVNQCDRVAADELAALHDWLEQQAPGTPRFPTQFAQVPSQLLGAPLVPRESAAAAGACGPDCTHGHAHAHEHHGHAHGAAHDTNAPRHGELFATWSASDHSVYRRDALRDLVKAMPAGVMRLKGLVRTDRAPGWAVVQFGGRHGSVRDWPAQSPPPAADAASAVVAIGVHGRLPVDALQRALQAARSVAQAA